ncbi:MAG: hypothetical protein M0R46_16095 [Candidatus Muirbacterium halophilum]|nr:hypothetical protein [Candidatus Muirbacterium halophilum]MCK9477438.1 hypothetical protein [Candidatus Muirbacterium halophilum]
MKKTMFLLTICFALLFSFAADNDFLNNLLKASNDYSAGNSKEIEKLITSLSSDIFKDISNAKDMEGYQNLGDNITKNIFSKLESMGISADGKVKLPLDFTKALVYNVLTKVKTNGKSPSSIIPPVNLQFKGAANDIFTKVMDKIGNYDLKINQFASTLTDSIFKAMENSTTENMGDNISNAVNKDVNKFLGDLGIDIED